MKAIVLEVFTDKFNGTQYEPGTEVDFDSERVAELEGRGLVKAIEMVEKPKGGRRGSKLSTKN